MPSTNKTANLNLNSWISTDKPKREDFVNDNILIDTAIATHLADTDVHMTSTLLNIINTQAVIGVIRGTGEASLTTTLPFEPTAIIVYLSEQPLNTYDAVNGYNVCNCAMACKDYYGKTPGIYLDEDQLTTYQSVTTPTNGIFLNLNGYENTYIYIAFR